AVLLALWLFRAPGAGTGEPPRAVPAAEAPSTSSPTSPAPLQFPSVAPSGDAPAPRGAFEGSVLSRGTGAGIPGAEVTFSRGGAAASVRAGDDGAFRFEPPEPGRWQLATASAPGHAPFAPEWGHSPVVLDARPGERVRGLAVWLSPLGAYRGRVVDAEDRPVEGAEVRVTGAGERALLPSADRVTSGPGGAFSISAPDGATLEARHPGHAPGRATLDFAARSTRNVTLRLGRAVSGDAASGITGRVVSGGAPVEGALVSARALLRGGPGSAEEAVAAQALSDADGKFALRDLSPARHLLSASRDGYTLPRPVVARPGEEVTLELSRGGAVAGRVVDHATGRPVPAFRVEVRRGGRGWRIATGAVTVVDAGGRFEMKDLAPGPVGLSVSAPGYLPSPLVEATVPEHPGVVEVAVALNPGGRLTGRVVDRVDGRPLPGARIALEGDGGSAPSLLDAGAAAVAGPDGAFAVSGLPAGTVAVLVSADGHHARIVAGLQVPDRGVAGPVEVKLSPVGDGEEPRVELAGIGVTMEARGRGVLRVAGVIPGSGAAEAGMAPGDEILSVEGRSVSDLGLAGAVTLIRGPEDTRVRLVVRRGDAPPAEVWVWRRLVRGRRAPARRRARRARGP
ncbi:MAG TPA: carboxypeptidase regulatory-like domain-containing protein, partial [Anaeromyxobacteraceae bacterium]|nr:carboxypeptidase regulatory-like domain-containing protein [Anaeromyxobacteraceae bacterium]